METPCFIAEAAKLVLMRSESRVPKKKGKNFRTAPYLIMHVHLTGDTLNNKAPYMDV